MGTEIPAQVLYASPVSLKAPSEATGRALPLSVVVHVLSFVSRTMNEDGPCAY
jgi:hypothetical protein